MPVIPGVVKLGSKNLRFRRKLAKLPHHLQFLNNLRHIQFSRLYTNLENYGITCVMVVEGAAFNILTICSLDVLCPGSIVCN